jgi:hypothetical protein
MLLGSFRLLTSCELIKRAPALSAKLKNGAVASNLMLLFCW